MADTSDEILASGRVTVDGQSMEAFEAFRKYFDILLMHWVRLAGCHVNFQGLDSSKGGGYYTEKHYADNGINLKAFRDTAQTLRTAGSNTQLQLNLIGETENLHHHWNDPASDAALHNYLTNKKRMEQDQQDLAGHVQSIEQSVAVLQDAMQQKRDAATKAVDGLINQALRNSPGDFEARLRTACESMEANNQGGGISGFGFHQHLYQHHGAPGENWSATDVRRDIENSVLKAFAVACQGLENADNEVKTHIEESFDKLLEALDAKGGPSNDTSGMTEEQLHEIFPTLPMDKLRNYLPGINSAMREAGLETPQEKAAFLATFAVESGELKFMRELRSSQSCTEMYGPEYAGKTFDADTPRDPDTPPNASIPYPYTNTSGQLGNTQPGDGDRYRGRGPFQLTGRANYRAAGAALGIDLENHPELAEQPENGFRIAAWFYNNHSTPDGRSLNEAVDQGDFAAVTSAVNGGMTGYAERKQYYDTATRVLSGN